MQLFFGTGAMIATANKSGTNTPRKFGVLQEVGVDFAFNIKELYGQKSFPIAIGRGTGKISGKAKAANLNGRLLADLFFNPTTAPSTTQRKMVEDERGTPSGSSPSTYTIANTTGVKDLGVFDTVTGLPLEKVAASPAAGQYSVNEATGVYTFPNTYANVVLVTYTYTSTITSASTFTIDNQNLGTAPFFTAVLGGLYKQADTGGTTVDKEWTLTLNQCTGAKWSLMTKQEDFMVPEFEFSAFADLAGIIGTLSFEE